MSWDVGLGVGGVGARALALQDVGLGVWGVATGD